MGIIILTTVCNSEQLTVGLPPIRRDKRQNIADVVTDHTIKIKQYEYLDVAGLYKLCFQKVKAILTSKLPNIELDLLWHDSYLRSGNGLLPGWSGYMQNVTQGKQ